MVRPVGLEKEWWGGKDSFFESSIGFSPVGLFFTEPDVKSKTSKSDTEVMRGHYSLTRLRGRQSRAQAVEGRIKLWIGD